MGLATSSTSELPDDQGGSSMELLIGEAAGGDQRGEECGKEQRSGSGSEASRADLAAEAITATASGEDLLPGGKGAAPGSSGSRPASTGTRGEAPASCSRPPSAGTAEAVPGSGPGTASATVIRSESRPGTAADQPVGSQPSRTGSAAERTRSSPASTPPPPVKSGSHGASPPSGKSGAKGETKAEKGGGGKGSKKSKKGKKAKISTGPAPVQSQLRVGGPLAPFLPGGIREAPPELWALRDRRATEALVRLNPAGEHKVTVLGLTRVEWPGFCPAVIPLRPVPFTSTLHSSIHTHTPSTPPPPSPPGFDRGAAAAELSGRQEAAERAAVALDYAATLPKDRCADSMLRASLHEVRFRCVNRDVKRCVDQVDVWIGVWRRWLCGSGNVWKWGDARSYRRWHGSPLLGMQVNCAVPPRGQILPNKCDLRPCHPFPLVPP